MHGASTSSGNNCHGATCRSRLLHRPAPASRRAIVICSASSSGASHYDILGVHSLSTAAEIKTAFRRLALRLHPDVCSDADATQRFARVTAAYETLSCERSRRDYDAHLAAQIRARPASFWGASSSSSASYRTTYRRAGQQQQQGRRQQGARGASSAEWWVVDDDEDADSDSDSEGYTGGGFYRWAQSGSHQTSWKANRRKRRMREQQQQQQRESTSQRGGQPSSSSGQTSSSGSTRGSRGAGGQGSGARRGRASAGGLGDLDALLAQLDEATLRGLKSVYGQGLQDLQDAEELQEFLEQIDLLRQSGMRFEQFSNGAGTRSSSGAPKGRPKAGAASSSPFDHAARQQQRPRQQQGAQPGSPFRTVYSREAAVNIDGWVLSGEDLEVVAELLGLEDLEELVNAIETEEEDDVEEEEEEEVVEEETQKRGRTAQQQHQAAGRGSSRGRDGGSAAAGGKRQMGDDWLWDDSDSDDEDVNDWVREARRYYGEVG